MDTLLKYKVPDTSNIRLAPKIRTQEEITPESIRRAMETWNSYLPRYIRLYNYYIGKQPIKDRKDSDNLVVSNLCYYIVNAFKGYMVGYAPDYTTSPDDKNAEEIVALYQHQNKARTEAEIAQNLSIYGTAYELVYLDKDGVPKSTVFAPIDAFVAYSGDVESDSVFGAVRYEEKDDAGVTTYRLYLYTRTDLEIWKSTSYAGPWERVGEPMPHGFGRVPLIEYSNNSERMGDFEQIITLQDAYNRLLSNRLDDKDAFVKSVLMIHGHVMGKTPDEVEESLSVLKEHRTLQFDDSDGDASYLEKTMDEGGVQVLQDQIRDDLHKLAMIPDMSDEQFSGNASGIAMAYKLFGTDQRVAEKIAQFNIGFTRRCKLYDTALHNPTRAEDFDTGTDIAGMTIVFKLNQPQDLSYLSGSLTTLVDAGIISKATARSNLLIVTDSQREEELIDAEREKDAEFNKATFEDDYANSSLESREYLSEDSDDRKGEQESDLESSKNSEDKESLTKKNTDRKGSDDSEDDESEDDEDKSKSKKNKKKADR